MIEAITLPGKSAELISGFPGFQNIKAAETHTAVVGYEHLRYLCVDRPLRRKRAAATTESKGDK